MKLIIDVPKEVYELIINDNSTKMIGFAKAVKNGIPLEQVRAEIEGCKQYQFETYGIQRYFKIDDIWQIIDKYRS